jgi:hypothetical protein
MAVGRPKSPTVEDLMECFAHREQLKQQEVNNNLRILKLVEALKATNPFIVDLVKKLCGNIKPNGKTGKGSHKKTV